MLVATGQVRTLQTYYQDTIMTLYTIRVPLDPLYVNVNIVFEYTISLLTKVLAELLWFLTFDTPYPSNPFEILKLGVENLSSVSAL